jgi:hypothetical protein
MLHHCSPSLKYTIPLSQFKLDGSYLSKISFDEEDVVCGT